ncbi:MAG: hypothetical protein MJ182_10025 [Treponema sp.]|nr:hypothetical protein [Treponema sp.]
MAKSFLKDYSIGKDIIDNVEEENFPASLPSKENEVLTGAETGKEEIPELESGSVKENENKKIAVRKEGLFTVFETGGTSYRIGGIKPLFVTSLRVNIRAGNGKVSYYDSIDLYASRGRASFAQGLYRTWGISPERVEMDLVRILELLEKERDERLLSKSKTVTTELTEEEKILGMNFLKDRNIFRRITEDMSTMGYVGEELNKILLYLCASSRKLDDPISVLIISQSASGKSYLVDTVRRLMPPEDVVAVTSLSDQALNYIDDLMHKFLILGEAVHSDVIEYQIREMLSGKELSRLVTVKDPETGKMQSQVVRTPVIVSSVMSGTNNAINPENASRCFVVNTDESAEQTKRIQESQRLKYSLAKLKEGNESKEKIIRIHRAAQKLLRKVNIVNDFAPLLNFPVKLMRTRRDHERFMDLIACVCFLRQYQKIEEEDDGIRFIRCDLEDYKIAYKIMVDGVLSSTMRELPAGAQLLYEQMRKYAKEEALKQELDPTEISMTQRQIREYSGQSQTVVKSGIRQLVEFEYINVVRGGGERVKGFYRIKSDEEIKKVDYSMIPTPLEMKELLKHQNQ